MNSSLKSMCLALSLCASTILCDNSGQPSSWKSLFSGLNLPSASSCSLFVTGLHNSTQSLFASARVKYNEPLLAKDGENTRLTKGNVFLGASLFFGATGLIGWNIWRYRKKHYKKQLISRRIQGAPYQQILLCILRSITLKTSSMQIDVSLKTRILKGSHCLTANTKKM